ncbi:hypothetical protein Syun_031114 [Stephania yunnanensis]|uniref:Uncharacterized protein n=1 Tax=Stephania yunnanensis TaxID=152371 RepID=A0AAP0DXN7_9MAGN
METGQREGEVKNTAEQGWRPAREQEVKKEVEFQNLLVVVRGSIFFNVIRFSCLESNNSMEEYKYWNA